jgi:hypothetical protein
MRATVIPRQLASVRAGPVDHGHNRTRRRQAPGLPPARRSRCRAGEDQQVHGIIHARVPRAEHPAYEPADHPGCRAAVAAITRKRAVFHGAAGWAGPFRDEAQL